MKDSNVLMRYGICEMPDKSKINKMLEKAAKKHYQYYMVYSDNISTHIENFKNEEELRSYLESENLNLNNILIFFGKRINCKTTIQLDFEEIEE